VSKKLNLVRLPSSEVSAEGFVGEKFVIETGNRRTLFLVFKSDDHRLAERLGPIQGRIREDLALGEDTKVLVLGMSTDDSFEIHELET